MTAATPASLQYRLATEADLADIVGMLADDPLGQRREAFQLPLPATYLAAFERIRTDPQQELTVVAQDGVIVGTFQLSFIQYLTYQGACGRRSKPYEFGRAIGDRASARPSFGTRSSEPPNGALICSS